MYKKYTCPHCGCQESWFVRRGGYKCTFCRREWAQEKYPIQNFRLKKSQWLRILDTYLRDKTGLAIHLETSVGKNRVYKITALIQKAMSSDLPEEFRDIIEVDGTYVGGSWKNKPKYIRKLGTKRGKGTRKQAIFGLLERNRGLVRAYLVKDESIMEVMPVIEKIVKKRSLICSDEHSAYSKLKKYGYKHQTVNHSRGEYVRGNIHTQTLEGFWGLLKNYLKSKGGIRRKNMQRFVDEFSWRYNHRNFSRKENVQKLFTLLKNVF